MSTKTKKKDNGKEQPALNALANRLAVQSLQGDNKARAELIVWRYRNPSAAVIESAHNAKLRRAFERIDR